MNFRNPTIWTAQFSGLRLHAFGIEQTLHWATRIEVYQARAKPQLWRARPTFTHGKHNWEASSAEELMRVITKDFEECVVEWKEYPAPIERKQVRENTAQRSRRRLPA